MKYLDLMWACAPETDKRADDIGRPWLVNGFFYATDGILALRVPASEVEDAPEQMPEVSTFQNLARGHIDEMLDAEVLLTFAMPSRETLAAATSEKECSDCLDGEVNWTSPSGEEYSAVCRKCGGEGTVAAYDPDFFNLASRFAATRQLVRLHDHWQASTLAVTAIDVFRFDLFGVPNGAGLLQGCFVSPPDIERAGRLEEVAP